MMTGERNLKDSVSAFLSAHYSMTLATSNGGQPWAAAVYYVHDERFRLYFVSDRESRHSRELESTATVAATIHDDPADWRRIKGVQLEGRAVRVTSVVDKTKALSLYLRKFPFVKDFMKSPLEAITHMTIAGKAVAFEVYRVEPKRLYFLDNQAGFSQREELRLE